MNFILCTSSIVFVALWQYAVAEQQCGKLNEAQLYNENPVTAIDEFPWIARIYYRDYDNNKLRYGCVATIISKKHLLTTYYCGEMNEDEEQEYVLVGDYDYGNSDTESDCDARTKCAPAAQKYMISDIIYHPNYNYERRMYDIALIHLRVEIRFNEFVQPICLPPPEMYIDDFVPQYFPLAGYLHLRVNPLNITKKVKTVAHVISNIRCGEKFAKMSKRFKPQMDSTVICTSFLNDNIFQSGSILMAVNVVETKLINFVLLGILSYGGTSVEDDEVVHYDTFMKVSSNINWIQSNINKPYIYGYKKFQNSTTWI